MGEVPAGHPRVYEVHVPLKHHNKTAGMTSSLLKPIKVIFIAGVAIFDRSGFLGRTNFSNSSFRLSYWTQQCFLYSKVLYLIRIFRTAPTHQRIQVPNLECFLFPVPYFHGLGVGIPLHRPYPYFLHR